MPKYRRKEIYLEEGSVTPSWAEKPSKVSWNATPETLPDEIREAFAFQLYHDGFAVQTADGLLVAYDNQSIKQEELAHIVEEFTSLGDSIYYLGSEKLGSDSSTWSSFYIGEIGKTHQVVA